MRRDARRVTSFATVPKAVALRQLLPTPGELTPAELMRDLRLGDLARGSRPYVVANMVCTLDGRAAIGGRSGPIGDEIDSELFHRLRTQVDAVLAGTGTLRSERYGRLVRDPVLRAQRRAEGLNADPLAVVVTRTLELPLDIPLFRDPDSAIAVFTSAGIGLPALPARVSLIRVPPTELPLPAVLARLRAEFGVRSVLCEGGPRLLASLVAAGVVDELFLTLAPKLAGGEEPTLIDPAGRPPAPLTLAPVWALEAAGSLYLRYRVTGGVP